MAEDKSRDDRFFNCDQEHELKYVSGRYKDSDKVYVFLKEKCTEGSIKYMKHKELYEFIHESLGYKVPV